MKNTKYTAKQMNEIKAMFKKNATIKDICIKFGISSGYAYKLKSQFMSEKKSVGKKIISAVKEAKKKGLTELKAKKIKKNKVVPLPNSKEYRHPHSHFIGDYVIVRCDRAGVHVGFLAEYLGYDQVLLKEARRIHYWEGAFTLSKIAQEGLVKARMSCVVPEILLHEIEVLPCSENAKNSLINLKEHDINDVR